MDRLSSTSRRRGGVHRRGPAVHPGLAGLSKHETARAGNTFGIAGMAHRPGRDHRAGARPRRSPASASACWSSRWLIGAAIGLWRARVVEMTGMPELIALLHCFVGLAAVLVGWNGYLHVEADLDGAEARLLTCRTCWASTTPRCSSASSSAR